MSVLEELGSLCVLRVVVDLVAGVPPPTLTVTVSFVVVLDWLLLLPVPKPAGPELCEECLTRDREVRSDCIGPKSTLEALVRDQALRGS